MISIFYSEGRFVPLVVCEQCGQPIRDAEMGMVAHGPTPEEGGYLDIAFLHKGQCDETYKGGDYREGGWEELSHFIYRLCHNSGMNIAKLKSAAEDVDDLGRLG